MTKEESVRSSPKFGVNCVINNLEKAVNGAFLACRNATVF